MDKQTKFGLMYAAGVVAAYLGYRYYKTQQGKAQAPTAPATGPAPAPKTVPGGPTFQGASQAYIKNVKILQSLLGVTADGIIGPITIKAGQAAGINYQINAATIDKAIAAAQLYKNKPGAFFDFINRK
jgi:murein L,D-transpeptidase YcbB/YkuD